MVTYRSTSLKKTQTTSRYWLLTMIFPYMSLTFFFEARYKVTYLSHSQLDVLKPLYERCVIFFLSEFFKTCRPTPAWFIYIYIIYIIIYIYHCYLSYIISRGWYLYVFFPRCSEVEYVEAGVNPWQDLTRWSTQTKVNVGLHKNPMI